MWYDHPNWWEWLILIAIAIIFVFVWWGSTGGHSDPLDDRSDDGREIH